MAWLLALLAVAAGLLEAELLARSVRSRAWGSSLVVRLFVVGAVLVVAARSGHLLLAGAGWLLGYLVGCAWAWRRMR